MDPIAISSLNQDLALPQSIGEKSIDVQPLSKAPTDIKIQDSLYNPQRTPEYALNNIFPDNKEESKLQKARKILGETAKGQSDNEIQVFVTELQCLIDSWFDYFEKEVFEGVTLKQLLREG